MGMGEGRHGEGVPAWEEEAEVEEEAGSIA